MELLDSRRLPGANILWERPGAVVDDGSGRGRQQAGDRGAKAHAQHRPPEPSIAHTVHEHKQTKKAKPPILNAHLALL